MILKSKVLSSFQGVAYGHMTLEAMQNWHLSKIDLLVREVIQNCSDASEQVEGEDCFRVAFNVREFNGKSFMDTLDGLDDTTKKRFSGINSKCLEIRDGGTTGLTGPLVIAKNDEEDHGNYYRLVFDTGKAQTQKNSGGNWGYGKSAYYGIGKGFVIYYSQIENKKSGGYESRLIVTLIENEENKDAILRGHINGSNSAGKAWWGKCLDGEGLNANILPLQDEEEIREFLTIFNITPFAECETGTSVIIPYVDYNELMNNMISKEMEVPSDIRNRCSWTYSDDEGFKEYLKLAVQKWYAPVINNLDLPKLTEKKKWLYASVNDELISYDQMYPFFKLVQRMYTASLVRTYGDAPERRTEWTSTYENTIKPINIRNYIDNTHGGNTIVGYLTIARLPKNLVDTGMGEGLNPYLLLGYYEETDRNRPIVMYSRRLGMVIDYAYKDEWVHGVPLPEDENEYIFSFFVPCLGEGKRLKSDLSVKKYAGQTLEQYLIECEASDHEGWEDHDRMTIVSSIQNRVVDNIKNIIKGDVIASTGTVSDRLGNAFSRMINITKKDCGKRISDGSGSSSGGGSLSKRIKFVSDISEFNEGRQKLDYTIECKPGLKTISITPIIYSDGSNIRSIEWEAEIRSTFPVEFKRLDVVEISTKQSENTVNVILDEDKLSGACETLEISISHDEKKRDNKSVYSRGLTRITFSFKSPIEELTLIKGSIFLNTADNDYEYDLIASEETR